jgi:DNA repair ATPase RecN
VTVETLTDRARLSEVARMLGGVGNGAAAVEHARALLAARGRPSRTARD